MTDEEYVKAHWATSPVKREHDEFGPVDLFTIHGWCSHEPERCYESSDEAWAAAAEFTRERLEQIEEIAEEITMLQGICLSPGNISAVRRCIKRAESALADLRKGMA